MSGVKAAGVEGVNDVPDSVGEALEIGVCPVNLRPTGQKFTAALLVSAEDSVTSYYH